MNEWRTKAGVLSGNSIGRIASLVTTAALVAFAYACANPGAPPGGAPDNLPPKVIKIIPTNGSIVVKPKDMLIQFDEVISETPRSAQNLAGIVFISPKSGIPSVSWRRSAMEIHPKKGWKPNTVYTVTVGAGITDLRGNVLDSTTRIVFSTGGAIPNTTVDGVVFDWQAGRGAPRAIVEAIAKDSTVYETIADSSGRFLLEHIPIGPYVLRAFVDKNDNRLFDPLEAWDTTSLALTSRGTAEFYAFSHDTIGTRIQDIVPSDSNTKLKITMDRPVSLLQQFTPPQFVLKKADSSVVQVAVVMTAPQRATFDSLVRKQKEDSINRAKQGGDTSALARARRDSAQAKFTRDSIARARNDEAQVRRLQALRNGRPAAAPDTTPPPKMHRPPLYTELYLTLDKPLEPLTVYRITINNVRSVSGTVRSPTRTFQTAKRAPRDSTGKIDSTTIRIKKP